MKIVVVGIGYVGVSNAILLSRHDNADIIMVDTNIEKVICINNGIIPIKDDSIRSYLEDYDLTITATTDGSTAYLDADLILICTSTNYNPENNRFDTSSVDSVIDQIMHTNSDGAIVIRSTVPIGYTSEINKKYNTNRILFAPEFLREGNALYDLLYPSRIIVGVTCNNKYGRNMSQFVINLFTLCSYKSNIPHMIMSSTEAEAVKLFSNTYLAMRISFFNELDTYAEEKGLDTRNIIRGVCTDPRIGDFYNNPSFGYGGYCLPKDTKQLLADFNDIPNDIMKAVVDSNTTRKNHITSKILNRLKDKSTIGIYLLSMKKDSDNYRSSAILDIIENLCREGKHVIVYEPSIDSDFKHESIEVVNDLEKFKQLSDIILANRYDKNIEDVKEKLYSRDIFHEN